MSRRPDRRGASAGFTLIEAVLALAIVGMTAAAVTGAVGAQLRTADRARHALEAAALAEQRLAGLRLVEPGQLRPLPDSLAAGRFAAPFADYTWTAASQPVRGEPDLFDLWVTVTWEGGAYPLRSRVHRPPLRAGRQ
jgi:type II secretion system protein I